MTTTYRYEDVARVQLETALRLYAEDEDLFSAITLAGAAEEILGTLLQNKRGRQRTDPPTALESDRHAAAIMHEYLYGVPGDADAYGDRVHRARNALKHMNSPMGTVTLDLGEEARDALDRAIRNYWRLLGMTTPAMDAFSRARREGEGNPGVEPATEGG